MLEVVTRDIIDEEISRYVFVARIAFLLLYCFHLFFFPLFVVWLSQVMVDPLEKMGNQDHLIGFLINSTFQFLKLKLGKKR